MLDLRELEKRLDEALAQETSDSLRTWLLSQRNLSLESYLGSGCMQQYKVCPSLFLSHLAVDPHYNCSNVDSPSDQLAFAA
jgi:hypothetical protein